MGTTTTLQAFGIPTAPGEGRGGVLQPKAKYKFRVVVSNFGVPTGSIQLTQQVMSVKRPSAKFSAVEVHSYNSRAYYAGKPEWEETSVKVRDDVTNSVNSLVGAQLQKQMNFFSQTSPLGGGNYKFQMLVDTMDGGDDTVLETWFFEGCFLTGADYDEFSYESSDPLTINLSIRFDNVTQTGGLMPTTPILTTSNGGMQF
ncbi:unnamed protein product [Sphagnum tenellum]